MTPGFLRQNSHLVYVFSFLSVVLIMIWFPSVRNLHGYLVLAALAFTSHIWCGDSLKKIGFLPKPIIDEKFFGLIGLTLVLGGWTWLVFEPVKPITVAGAVLKITGGSIWGLVQQYALNGFLFNRLADYFGDENNPRVLFFSAAIFSLLHFPNHFLMIVTFVCAHICVKIFLKTRNLYFIGIAHGIISFFLLNFLPLWLTKGMVVGPGYFRVMTG